MKRITSKTARKTVAPLLVLIAGGMLMAPAHAAPPSLGLVAHYAADGNFLDSTGVNNGTSNGTTFIAGKVGPQAFSFNGVDNYITIPRSIQDDFSIAFWFKSTQNAGQISQWWQGTGLVDAEVPGVTTDFGVTFGGGRVLFGVGAPDVTIRSGLLNNGQWHHVVATRQKSNGAMRLYINGVLFASATGGTHSLTAPAEMRMGFLYYGGNPFAGALDEVRIYGRVLSATEVASSIINDAPVAKDADVSTNEDTVFNGQLVATDATNDPRTYSKVSGPSHGTATVNANGTFTYTPAPNYHGPDSFTFKANDGTVDSNVATVNITVNSVDDAPVVA
ncbi:MAG TPA: LamG-like jellyroll fold domain-containing protein, partial [Abditibacteriaceae bacterium]